MTAKEERVAIITHRRFMNTLLNCVVSMNHRVGANLRSQDPQVRSERRLDSMRATQPVHRIRSPISTILLGPMRSIR